MPYIDGMVVKGNSYDFRDNTATHSVNNIEPDEYGNITVNRVPLADNLYYENAKASTGTFSTRIAGGGVAVSDGEALITSIKGNMNHVGFVARDVKMEVDAVGELPRTDPINVSVNKSTFVSAVGETSTVTFTYTTAWDKNLSTYGATVTGTPVNGDTFVVEYVAENIDLSVQSSSSTPITATINSTTWKSVVTQSGQTVFTYTTAWDKNPTTYGITVSGTPTNGDTIVVDYTKEVFTTTVYAVSGIPRENPIVVTIDKKAYDDSVDTSGTVVYEYTTSWNINPASHGMTITNTPVSGDKITVTCTKEQRGEITVFDPSAFYSTGWNLFDASNGFAFVKGYEYGYIIGGTFNAMDVKYSTTIDGQKASIPNLVYLGDGQYYFDTAEDIYVWLTGFDVDSVYIFMTRDDWQTGHAGEFEEYTISNVIVSSVMANFPYGLMRVGDVYDELDFSIQTAYSRIQRMAYNNTNLVNAENSGRGFVYDSDYIYIVKDSIDITTYSFQIDGDYTVSSHGIEGFNGSSVDGVATILYGQNLKNKLISDVVTISPQELDDDQKKQVRNNIGAISSDDAVTVSTNQLVTGQKTFSNGVFIGNNSLNPQVGFFGYDSSVVMAFGAKTSIDTSTSETTSSCFSVTQYASMGGNLYAQDSFELPKTTSSSSGQTYSILTTKSAVTIAQGGTGATTVANARTALGVPASSEVVKLTGTQTIAGTKVFNDAVHVHNASTSPVLYFSSKDLTYENAANIQVTTVKTAPKFQFAVYSRNSSGTRLSYYETYSLPAVTVGRTSNAGYSILTTKSAVTVAQGGTGATTAANARTNLGLKDGATSTVANNLTTTATGYVLDARQGKALDDAKVNHMPSITSVEASGTGNVTLTASNQYLIIIEGMAANTRTVVVACVNGSGSVAHTVLLAASSLTISASTVSGNGRLTVKNNSANAVRIHRIHLKRMSGEE